MLSMSSKLGKCGIFLKEEEIEKKYFPSDDSEQEEEEEKARLSLFRKIALLKII